MNRSDTSKLKLYKGCWIRPAMRADGAMVKESLHNYGHFRFNDRSIVLDLGANIGAFGRMALGADVKPQNYIAYEPDPKNVELLILNTNPDIRLNVAVATMSREKSLTFYQTDSSNSACSGTACPPTNQSKSMRKVRYEVKNEYLPSVIDFCHPTHLKMDIEGAEHEWLMENRFKFPNYIKEIALELHRGDTIDLAEELWSEITKVYDVVSVTPNDGFIRPDSPKWGYKNIGISGKGVLFGIDIFLRRK